MINYSVSLRANPTDPEEAKKAYATAQTTDTLTIDTFAEHISSHGSKYSRSDIYAVLMECVSCMREQLLLGNAVQLGDLGSFSVSLHSKGATSIADFTSDNIKKVNVTWSKGKKFKNLKDDATFSEVLTRKAAAAALKAKKESTTANS